MYENRNHPSVYFNLALSPIQLSCFPKPLFLSTCCEYLSITKYTLCSIIFKRVHFFGYSNINVSKSRNPDSFEALTITASRALVLSSGDFFWPTVKYPLHSILLANSLKTGQLVSKLDSSVRIRAAPLFLRLPVELLPELGLSEPIESRIRRILNFNWL